LDPDRDIYYRGFGIGGFGDWLARLLRSRFIHDYGWYAMPTAPGPQCEVARQTGEKLLEMSEGARAAKTFDLLAEWADIGKNVRVSSEDRSDFILGLALGLGRNDLKSGFCSIARSLVARGWPLPRVTGLVSGYLGQLDVIGRLPKGESDAVQATVRQELGLLSPKK
jgi:hypothetical protein